MEHRIRSGEASYEGRADGSIIWSTVIRSSVNFFTLREWIALACSEEGERAGELTRLLVPA